MRAMSSLFASLMLIYFAASTLLFVGQRKLIYFPTPESAAPGAEELRIERDGHSLQVWKVAGTGQDAMLYFGGNADDVAGSIDHLSAALPGHTLYLANYRGYGGSTGSPSEAALLGDALALFDHIAPEHGQVSAIGRSLGSGVAAQLAAQRPLHKLILVTPFDSITNVARRMLPIFPVSLLLRDKFDSASIAASISAPTLVIVAEDDEVIARPRTDALIAAFPVDQLDVKILEGATHNSIDLFPAYAAEITAFIGSGEAAGTEKIMNKIISL